MRSLPLLELLLAASCLASGALSASSRAPADEDDDTPLPLVIWHGLGDSVANEGLREVGALAEAVNPGTLVYYVTLGADGNADRSATFFGDVNSQLAEVCDALAAHPILSTAPAIDAIGFSQGGQFLRGYVERCNDPPVRSLVTMGSQHNGITRFKDCAASDYLCKGAMALLRFGAWSSFVQTRLVPAQYLRDPADYENYLAHSNFLADVNNERGIKSPDYRKNLASLANLVLVMFEDDTTVIPKETSWFEEVNGTESTPLRARKLYAEDWIGLRELDRKGGLKFRSVPGDHMQLTEEGLNATFAEFFGPFKKTFRADPLGEPSLRKQPAAWDDL